MASQSWSTVVAGAEEQPKREFKPYNAKLGNEIEHTFISNNNHPNTVTHLTRSIVSARNGGVRIDADAYSAQVEALQQDVSACLHHAEGPFTRTLVQKEKDGKQQTVMLWSLNYSKSRLFTTSYLPMHRFGLPGSLTTVHVPVGSDISAEQLIMKFNALLSADLAPQLGNTRQ